MRGFRPRWSDLARALIVSAAYLALVVPRGWAPTTASFGNPAPDIQVPPFVLTLGPWPQRAVILVVLAALGFVVVRLPWRIFAPRSAPARPTADRA